MARKINVKEVKARIKENLQAMRGIKKGVTSEMAAVIKGDGLFDSAAVRADVSKFIKAANAVEKDRIKLAAADNDNA